MSGRPSRFLGRDGRPGEHQAVFTLLAVAAGHPMMTDRLLVALSTHELADLRIPVDGAVEDLDVHCGLVVPMGGVDLGAAGRDRGGPPDQFGEHRPLVLVGERTE
jgi:hypothetical protein